jgi:hypothetical protein
LCSHLPSPSVLSAAAPGGTDAAAVAEFVAPSVIPLIVRAGAAAGGCSTAAATTAVAASVSPWMAMGAAAMPAADAADGTGTSPSGTTAAAGCGARAVLARARPPAANRVPLPCAARHVRWGRAWPSCCRVPCRAGFRVCPQARSALGAIQQRGSAVPRQGSRGRQREVVGCLLGPLCLREKCPGKKRPGR